MELFFSNQIVGNLIEMPESEAHHLLNVLRYKIGDELKVTNGKGDFFESKIIEINKKKCVVEIIKIISIDKPKHYISIAIAPTKNRERLEWFFEKATEIGIDEIQLIKTQYSEKSNVAIDRLQKVLLAAIKQSNQAWLPILKPMIDFEKLIHYQNDYQQSFICHNLPPSTIQLIKIAKPHLKTLIMIGPEGGFSNHEIDLASKNKFQTVLLGNNKLRTETAGIIAASILKQINL